jgi:plasmid maintenance system killer protein
MSETPLTDDAVKEVLQTGQHAKVKAEFAREMEKRLAAITKQRDDLFRALAEPIRPAD